MPNNKTYIKTDKNGTKYFEELVTCDRCGGHGLFFVAVLNGHGVPAQPDNGICYKCHGAGKVREIVKVYTPEHEAKLAKQRAARAAKREAQIEAERQAALAEAAKERITWLLEHGFNADGWTNVFVGETFGFKDQLKELGAKYCGQIGWHVAPKDVPFPFPSVQIHIDELCFVNDWGEYRWKEDVDFAELIKTKEAKAGLLHESQFVGKVGERIEVELQLVHSFWYDTQFGTTWIHKFQDKDGNILVWKTSNCLSEVGSSQRCIVKGTIKEHSQYNDENQTMLSRCKIIKVFE